MNVKTCTKCKNEYPATLEFFYKHPSSKFGVTPRCKPCVNIDNIESHKKRMEKDPEKIRQQGTARTKKYYHRDLDKSRTYQRERARNISKSHKESGTWDEYLAKRRAGKYNLSLEELENLFKEQNYSCAICKCTEPVGKTKWNIDHCHKSNKVRFILCCHCNRGLGAFKDSPELLRIAANLLESKQL